MSPRQVVEVDFVASYTGANNIKKAHNDISTLGGAAKKLGGILATTFATQRLIQFGKASITAFAAQDRGIKVLENTLQNFGLQMQSVGMSQFIDKISLATGKTTDMLIPAFTSLVRVTGDVAKAQELLQLSLDISAGTTKEVTVVATALGRAYMGNTTSLSKLNAGISAADLKTKNFTMVQKKLNAIFQGDSTVAANTYGGKIDRLNEAFKQMQENIGQGLIMGFEGANSSAQKFSETLDKIVKAGITIGAAAGGLARLFGKIGDIPVVGDILKKSADGWQKILGVQDAIVAYNNNILRQNDALQVAAMANAKQQETLRKANLAAQLKADNAAKKTAADKLKSERDSLNLKLAGSTLDMQNIQIQAALQRGQSKEVNDVLLLQRAIMNQNSDQAEVLAQRVLTANGLVMDIKGNISSLENAKNPFADWPKQSETALNEIKLLLAQLSKMVIPITLVPKVVSDGMSYPFIPEDPSKPSAPTITPSVTGNTEVFNKEAGIYGPNGLFSGNNGSTNVNITVTASPDVTVASTQAASTNGTVVTVNRLDPLYAYR